MRNYDYRWRLTMPQIELMGADLPHTLYRRKDSRGNGVPTRADIDEATMLYLKEKERRAREREKAHEMTVGELFEKEMNT